MNYELVWYKEVLNNSKKLFRLSEKTDEKEKFEYYSKNDNNSIFNLTKMTYVNIPSIMHVLEERYKINKIYTFNGKILISINPFKKINIYSDIDNIDTEQPHVYSLAETAYLNSKYKNQSILVSGESGSGKTENTKYILNYLCKKYSVSDILSKRIIGCNYLIELFGNAKTLRNDNSSRFGKFIQLFIDNNQIKGGKITNYLLEKSRVSFVNKLEKTYHIFYLSLINHDKLKKYDFKSINQYNILNNSNFNYKIDEFENIE